MPRAADDQIADVRSCACRAGNTRRQGQIVDQALDEARIETDPAKRRAAYSRLWAQERADLPIIYLYTPSYIVGATKKITGYKVLPDGLIRLQGVGMQQN